MVYQHKNILSPTECKKLIKLCSSDLRPIASSNPFDLKADFFFTPENELKGTVFEVNDERISWLIDRICSHFKINPENLEHPRFQKYKVGGTYRSHYDFILLDKEYTEYHFSRGGQRIKSYILYLNDDFEGGETIFPRKSIIVEPEVGKIIEWNNVVPGIDINSKESYDLTTSHSALPVLKGTKYIFAIFLRERSFIGTKQEWLKRFPERPSKHENKVKGFAI